MENMVPQKSGNVMEFESSKLTDSMERKKLAGDFEEVIKDIDKEIQKFDLAASNIAENRACLGKENIIESPSIKDSNEMLSQARAQLNPSLPRALLAVISNNQNRPVHAEGSWKRVARTEIGIDTVMIEAVREERVAGETESLLELPKKRKVS